MQFNDVQIPTPYLATSETSDLVSLLRCRATEQADDTAYVFLEKGERELVRLSFSELDRRARAIASFLRDSDVADRGARALLLYPSGLDYIEAFFGCLYAGIVAVPAYPPSGRHLRRLRAVVEDARPALILTVKKLRDRFGESGDGSFGATPWIATDEISSAQADDWTPRAVKPESVAFLQYTSGSTGARAES